MRLINSTFRLRGAAKYTMQESKLLQLGAMRIESAARENVPDLEKMKTWQAPKAEQANRYHNAIRHRIPQTKTVSSS